MTVTIITADQRTITVEIMVHGGVIRYASSLDLTARQHARQLQFTAVYEPAPGMVRVYEPGRMTRTEDPYTDVAIAGARVEIMTGPDAGLVFLF